MREREPPEGPEPDYMCPYCGRGVMGSVCNNCEMKEEEARKKFEEEMEEKRESFIQDCIEHGIARPDEQGNRETLDFDEVEVKGNRIKVVPRFTVCASELMKIPAVQEVALEGRGQGPIEILVHYDPDEVISPEEVARRLELGHTILNTYGPRQTARALRDIRGQDEPELDYLENRELMNLQAFETLGLEYR